MSANAEIIASLVRENINRAINDVFQPLLGRAPALVGMTELSRRDDLRPPFSGPVSGADTFVVGTVGFQGDINGLICLYLDEALARLATGRLRRMSAAAAAGDEVVNDAIGEITRQTVGGFRDGLHNAGYACMPTIPSILRGSNFSIESASTTIRLLYEIALPRHKVAVDILFQVHD